MSLFVRTIVKKRDGGELSEGEIDDFVAGVTDGDDHGRAGGGVPDGGLLPRNDDAPRRPP